MGVRVLPPEPAHLDFVGALHGHFGDVVVGLESRPFLRVAAESLVDADNQLRRQRSPAVHQVIQFFIADAQVLGGLSDGKAQGFQTFVEQYLAGMERAEHWQANFTQGVPQTLDLDAVIAVKNLGKVIRRLQSAPDRDAGAKCLV